MKSKANEVHILPLTKGYPDNQAIEFKWLMNSTKHKLFKRI